MQYFPFIHAAFHWIVVSRNYFVVVSFSISNEVYREIFLSEEILSLRPSSGDIGLSVLGGMLCVHSNSVLLGKTTFKVWILKEFGVKESWMPLLTIVKDTCLFNASPKYRFADGEVLFRCIDFESRGHAFRMVSGPFKSWPQCDTIQSGHMLLQKI
ncbi:hypothetical protein R3W88_028786 [Solanum pinnatisectum]|uniref:F-box associated domain-containing protein n=1 Tax=Solanum pinnatisectum TaxID=50273 RepID=A0AAV9K3F4_9SOLN|nr:hypothetical protein R3W88_028786 [Solanum pinnatisectum]